MIVFIKAEEISRNRVRYTDTFGKNFIYNKGSWAWRNNNPGNIRKPSKENMPAGVIGLAVENITQNLPLEHEGRKKKR
jgi:hypothetical protein